jgi:hypothetical protein
MRLTITSSSPHHLTTSPHPPHIITTSSHIIITTGVTGE